MQNSSIKTAKITPRKVHATVPLVVDGQPTAKIVAPTESADSGAWQTLATQVRDQIKSWTGVALPIVAPVDVQRGDNALLTDEAKQSTLLFIGNMFANAALLEPYVRRILVADDVTPEAGQPCLQTHSNPWWNGHGIALVGGSDARDADEAFSLFKEHAEQHAAEGDLALPRIWLPGPDHLLEGAKTYQRIARPQNEPWVASLYKTGALHLGYENGRQIYEAVHITDLGLFDSDQLCDIEQQMLDMALMIPKRVWWYAGPDIRNGRVAGRHENFKNTRLLHMVEYLLNAANLEDADAREQLEVMRDHITAYYDYILTRAYRNDHEGSEESHGWASIFWHALVFGQRQYFESGRAFDAAFHMFLSTDNLGGAAVHAQYGGVEEPNYPTGLIGTLCVTAWGLRDGRFRWLIENMPYYTGAHYAYPLRFPIGDIEPVCPTKWLGVQTQPLSEHSYNESIEDKRWAQPNMSRDETADVLTFRNGFKPSDQYLAIDAFQNQFQPLGLASVLRYVDRGKVWLVAHTGVEGNYDKSGLAVSRGMLDEGKQDVGEPWGSSVAVAQDEAVGYGSLKSQAYHDTDWTRHILWKKGDYFVYFDHVKALREGPFHLTATWRTLHPAFMEDGRWTQRIDDDVCTIEPSQPMMSQAGREPEAKYQGECVPFLLRQYKSFDAPNGDESTCIVNLVSARDKTMPQPEIRMLTETTVIVRVVNHLVVYGIGGWQADSISATATAFVIESTAARVVGGAIEQDGNAIVEAAQEMASTDDVDFAQLLQSLWEQAAPQADAQAESETAKDALTPAWSCDRLEPQHERLHAPKAGGRLASGSWKDTLKPEHSTYDVDWRAQFDHATDIDHVLVVAESQELQGGERWPEFGSSPAWPYPVELDKGAEEKCELLIDGKRKRGRLDQRLVGPTGKSFFKQQTVLRYEGDAVSQIELRLNNALPLKDVEVYGSRTATASIIQLQYFDEQSQTIFARTTDHQVVCIDASGNVLWHKRFEKRILAATALDTPAGRRLVLTDAECGLWQITREGAVDKHEQLETQSDNAAEFFDQDLIQNRIYAIGSWQRPDCDHRKLFFGSYQSVAWLDADDKLNWLPPESNDMIGRRGHVWRGLIYWDKVLPTGIDLNGDGIEDQAVLGRGYATQPSLILFDGKTLDPIAEIEMPNGYALHLSAEQVAGETRIYAVNALQAMVVSATGERIWSRRFDTPASAAAVHRGEVYVAKDDGMLLRFDEQGQLAGQSSWVSGSTDIAVNDDAVFVAGARGIQVSDHDWANAHCVNIPAKRVLLSDDNSIVIAGNDGRIVKLSLGK